MKLHVGSGNKRIPGWANVDIRKEVKPDFLCPAEDLRDIRGNTVDALYASHVLEHFPLAQVPQVLAEWHRVLKPGGQFYVAVPDFRALVWLYLENGTPLARLRGALWGGQEYKANFHFTGWDHDTLVAQLKPHFKEIRKVLNFSFLPASFRDYSSFQLDGYACSLNLEGVAR